MQKQSGGTTPGLNKRHQLLDVAWSQPLTVSNNFNMEDLPQLSPPLNDKVLNKIIEQLNDKKFVFEFDSNNANALEDFKN